MCKLKNIPNIFWALKAQSIWALKAQNRGHRIPCNKNRNKKEIQKYKPILFKYKSENGGEEY